MGASAAAAIMIRKQRDLVDHFRRLRATSPETARPQPDLGVESSRAWKQLQDHAVIREAAPGTWYLDEPSYAALNHMRRRMLMIVLILMAAAVLIPLIHGMLNQPKP